jgi:hypothetical protein
MRPGTAKNDYVTCAFFFPLFFACSSFLGPDIEDVITQSFNVSEGGILTMNVNRGSIKVNPGSGDVIKVKVIRTVSTSNEKKAQEIFKENKIDFHHSGRDVTIKTDDHVCRKGLFSWFRDINFRMHFIITIPGKYNLNLKSSGGSISVGEIHGDAKAKTSGGSLSFANIKGPVWARTSGGSIRLEGCLENADIQTSGGGIQIGTVEGEVKAITSGGSIDVKEIMGTINAGTTGGSIWAYISKQPKSDCSLITSGGSITIALAKDIKVNVDAKTSGGRVSTDFPITMQGEISKRQLRGKINGGGPQLHLKTSGGSIHVKKV